MSSKVILTIGIFMMLGLCLADYGYGGSYGGYGGFYPSYGGHGGGYSGSGVGGFGLLLPLLLILLVFPMLLNSGGVFNSTFG
ncbi:hypothetical protein ACJMK2_018476 [Sinanodonta woodiana]|uniref:Uncharacterized protein n=1 Tax=Sinanodonta woodiana TaxID=1069815 RepID=A0ABD3UDF4_SINWO